MFSFIQANHPHTVTHCMCFLCGDLVRKGSQRFTASWPFWTSVQGTYTLCSPWWCVGNNSSIKLHYPDLMWKNPTHLVISVILKEVWGGWTSIKMSVWHFPNFKCLQTWSPTVSSRHSVTPLPFSALVEGYQSIRLWIHDFQVVLLQKEVCSLHQISDLWSSYHQRSHSAHCQQVVIIILRPISWFDMALDRTTEFWAFHTLKLYNRGTQTECADVRLWCWTWTQFLKCLAGESDLAAV